MPVGALLPRRGAIANPILMAVERNLTAADIVSLAVNPGAKTAIPSVQRLKSRHHEAARLVAQGMKYTDIAVRTEYTAQRIGDLASRDPAFMDLVSYYKTQIDEIGIDDANRIKARFLDVTESALIELQERMEDPVARKKMNITELAKLSEMGADRTVAPPKTADATTTVPTRITFNIGTRDIRPKDSDKVEPLILENSDDPPNPD